MLFLRPRQDEKTIAKPFSIYEDGRPYGRSA
jgi:hypothetical protein